VATKNRPPPGLATTVPVWTRSPRHSPPTLVQFEVLLGHLNDLTAETTRLVVRVRLLRESVTETKARTRELRQVTAAIRTKPRKT